jgi:phenylacetate-coenzyme A ligase PaaK-like adenylate-forming protein
VSNRLNEKKAYDLRPEIECAARVAQALRTRLNLRVAVQAVPPGALPRWELKARRVVDRRG